MNGLVNPEQWFLKLYGFLYFIEINEITMTQKPQKSYEMIKEEPY